MIPLWAIPLSRKPSPNRTPLELRRKPLCQTWDQPPVRLAGSPGNKCGADIVATVAEYSHVKSVLKTWIQRSHELLHAMYALGPM